MEPTTAVVRGGKRSLRARITAREALSNVILGSEVYVCLSLASQTLTAVRLVALAREVCGRGLASLLVGTSSEARLRPHTSRAKATKRTASCS